VKRQSARWQRTDATHHSCSSSSKPSFEIFSFIVINWAGEVRGWQDTRSKRVTDGDVAPVADDSDVADDVADDAADAGADAVADDLAPVAAVTPTPAPTS
jgi:hypothetical protein